MEIVILGHPVLKEKALPIENIDGEIKSLVEQMAETMYKAKGLGLAANQVGVLKRVFLLDVSQKEGTPKLEVYINPEILQTEGYTTYEEGCLSIPGYYAKVERHAKLYIRALDLNGNPFERELEGLHAIAFQHEYDHLEGILFIDHLSPLKRSLFQKWWKKNKPKK
ncbi:peptide deformylase [Thermodesulfobacterium hveragerdense]|uniref:peptide deformylase n=1 Tax=Thermodesulfobacterium hveragerdense TaxID=53424 RepID=UPI0004136863|nr:peptide deformylase [Thermodesulfobacterium hveragerdense]